MTFRLSSVKEPGSASQKKKKIAKTCYLYREPLTLVPSTQQSSLSFTIFHVDASAELSIVQPVFNLSCIFQRVATPWSQEVVPFIPRYVPSISTFNGRRCSRNFA